MIEELWCVLVSRDIKSDLCSEKADATVGNIKCNKFPAMCPNQLPSITSHLVNRTTQSNAKNQPDLTAKYTVIVILLPAFHRKATTTTTTHNTTTTLKP